MCLPGSPLICSFYLGHHPFMVSFCKYALFEKMYLSTPLTFQIVEPGGLYAHLHCLGKGSPQVTLEAVFPAASFPGQKLWTSPPDGVLAVCLAVNFLRENATFADSNHKYNPIKSYYVNLNREGDKTRQWNVSFRPKWVDFSGHKESPLGWFAAVIGEHANQATD